MEVVFAPWAILPTNTRFTAGISVRSRFSNGAVRKPKFTSAQARRPLLRSKLILSAPPKEEKPLARKDSHYKRNTSDQKRQKTFDPSNEPVIHTHQRNIQYLIWRLIKKTFKFLSKSFKMASAGDSQLFDETFTITTLNHEKYDRVGRFGATSADSQTVMTLDVNTELYPLSIGETIHLVLASSLALDGSKDDTKGWRDVARNGPGGEATLADMFDYVCHGKIYKFEDGEDGHTM